MANTKRAAEEEPRLTNGASRRNSIETGDLKAEAAFAPGSRGAVTPGVPARDAIFAKIEARIDGLERENQLLKQTISNQNAEAEALREALTGSCELLHHRNDELQKLIQTIQLTRLLDQKADKQAAYLELVSRVRELVNATIPRDATVIVVSKGDDELLRLYGRRGIHFPRGRNGLYSGYYPRTSTAAIVHLESLRACGAEYFILPETAFWWLDHYTQFKQHLENRYPVVARREDTALIYALRGCLVAETVSVNIQLIEVFDKCRGRTGHDPAILDWDSGFDLAHAFPEETIFSPPAAGDKLPHLDETVDIVVLGTTDPSRITEAHRVAKSAVVTLTPADAILKSEANAAVTWKEKTGLDLATVSVVIPCSGDGSLAESCLFSLRETLPRDFGVDIILVDDGMENRGLARLEEVASRVLPLKILPRDQSHTGFIASCNRGAIASEGEILLFLHQDAILQTGWLLPMQRLFHACRDAGAVGGKILYLDGRLREAGGILYSDGSAANFGDGDYNFDSTQYNHIRKVDFCSTTFLATRRSVFAECGGLIPYESDGCAERDYCLRLREKGYATYYQPECLIVQRENTKDDHGSGRVANDKAPTRDIFRKKWSKRLRKQPASNRDAREDR